MVDAAAGFKMLAFVELVLVSDIETMCVCNKLTTVKATSGFGVRFRVHTNLLSFSASKWRLCEHVNRLPIELKDLDM